MKIKAVDFCRGLREKVHEELKDKPFQIQKDILYKGVKEAGMEKNVVPSERDTSFRKINYSQ